MEKLIIRDIIRDEVGICDRCVKTCNLILEEPRNLGAKEYDSWRSVLPLPVWQPVREEPPFPCGGCWGDCVNQECRIQERCRVTGGGIGRRSGDD